eukprot:365183-Chlamydomonas_euryale.AAC.3
MAERERLKAAARQIASSLQQHQDAIRMLQVRTVGARGTSRARHRGCDAPTCKCTAPSAFVRSCDVPPLEGQHPIERGAQRLPSDCPAVAQ